MTACKSASNGVTKPSLPLLCRGGMCNSAAPGMHNSRAVDMKSAAALCTSSSGQAKPFMRMSSCRDMSVMCAAAIVTDAVTCKLWQ